MQSIVSTNTAKTITRISVTIERLQEIIKSLQLAEGNALPGQEIDLEVAPGIIFTYDPQVPTFSAQADRARKNPGVGLNGANHSLDPSESVREGQLVQ